MNKLEVTRFKELDYACSEAVNTLCTNLTFMGSGKKKIMLTSCVAHEGKSFISMNLMRTFAQLGHKVLLIDADLRRSQIAVQYRLRYLLGGEGLTHYLAGKNSLDEVVYETDIPGAYMVPAGYLVSNSLALLSSGRFGQMLAELEDRFEYILVDAPPVGTIIDAAEIAKHCDGTVFVVKYNAISRKELQAAKQQIMRAGCEIMGVVLNDVEFDSLISKKYYNKAYYARYDSDDYRLETKKTDAEDRNTANRPKQTGG